MAPPPRSMISLISYYTLYGNYIYLNQGRCHWSLHQFVILILHKLDGKSGLSYLGFGIWDYYPKDKPEIILGMEVILVDEKGNRIQASVKQKLLKRFKRDLKEGECLDIMNFEVLANDGDYRGTTHPYKINFQFTTFVKPCDKIPNLSRFNFSPFSEIISRSVDDVFIDILGEIVGMSNITEKNYAGKQSKLLKIQLRDLSETIIDCTLWEKHAEDVHSYVKNNTTGPVILLGSLMRIKKFHGRILVQNSHFSTKLFLNEDLEEIGVFKNKITKNGKSVLLGVSALEPPTSLKKSDNSFSLSLWKTISQFTSSTEESTCVAFAMIVSLQMERPWFYIGCRSCLSTATPYFNPETEEIKANKYSCDTCEKNETSTEIRYKVNVKVADHTGTTSFLLFDREVIQLIHKSAYQLLEQQVQFNREGQIPDELMDLEGKNIVWTIRVTGKEKYYRQPTFKVVKLTQNSETIQKFQDNVLSQDATHSELPSISSTSTAIQMENTSSEAYDHDSPRCSPNTPITKRSRTKLIEDEGVHESSTKPNTTTKLAKGESDDKRGNMKNKNTKAKR